jgi:TRL (tRNA-associated locus)-like protein
MRKVGRQFTLAVMCAALLSGCVVGHAPVTAAITLNERGPVSAGSAAGQSKVGRATAVGIVLFAHGDASISAAMANGGITRIHHVDHETLNILGVYAKYTTIVYGE